MLIAGNWKMNAASMEEFGKMLARAPEAAAKGVDLLVCPPFVLLHRLAEQAQGSVLEIGAQDSHYEDEGAFTGNVSPRMLADSGATAVILGHSERRSDHRESDELVAKKALAAQRAGLRTIVCVGESEEERDAGEAEAVVTRQLIGSLPDTLDPAGLIVAYEPVWAIGTGRTASTDDIGSMHGLIRSGLARRLSSRAVPILYGGSVKPANASQILSVDNVGGALVGGASLKADDFLAIALAAPDGRR